MRLDTVIKIFHAVCVTNTKIVGRSDRSEMMREAINLEKLLSSEVV